MSSPFLLKDCALSVISTGESAASLPQLREIIGRIHLGSIYYHFWGARLRSSFEHPEYHNDFAKWAHFSLRDHILAERLSILDPNEYKNLEDLRHTLIDILDERLEEIQFILWKKEDDNFYFLRSSIVVFDLGKSANHPSELKGIIPNLTSSSIFYHFIDARSRTPDHVDDFTSWLANFKEEFEPLINKIKHIDPYFLSLLEIKQKLTNFINEQFT